MRAFFDPDPLLRRLERRALLFCLAAAVVGLVVRRGGLDVALGVLGGGLLVAVSYWAIRTSVTALVELAASAADRTTPVSAGERPPGAGVEGEITAPGDLPPPRPGRLAILVRLAGRYALLSLLAYAMIARLRLHPIGLLIGVSSLFVATSLEAAQVVTGGRKRPRV